MFGTKLLFIQIFGVKRLAATGIRGSLRGPRGPQNNVPLNLSKRMKFFVEISMKTGLLSLKSVRKDEAFC